MKVYEALAQAIADNGLPPIFGLAGDANLFFVDAYASAHLVVDPLSRAHEDD